MGAVALSPEGSVLLCLCVGSQRSHSVGHLLSLQVKVRSHDVHVQVPQSKDNKQWQRLTQIVSPQPAAALLTDSHCRVLSCQCP